MNEKRIQEVIEIERRAQDIVASAQKEAERLPALAEAEGQDIISRARAAAEEEALRLVEQARALDQVAVIVAATQNRIAETEKLAGANFEQAVAYVLERVIGRA